MLHHAMQCTGASCRMLQIPGNFAADTTQLRDANSKRPTYGTPILSHRGAFTKTCFHTGIYTYTCFYSGMVLHANTANTFMRRCFSTGMLLYPKTFTHRRVGTSTRRCLYTAMLSQRSAFTRTCENTGLLLTQVSFYTENVTLNTLTQRCSPHRKTFVQRRLFRHMHLHKRIFARIL